MKRIYFLFLIFFVISCGSLKEISTENTQDFKGFSDTIFVEKQVKLFDTIFVEVPPMKTGDLLCDSLCSKQTKLLLNQLNINRKTEKSQIKLYFDQYKNQLVLYNELNEQFNTYKAQNKQEIQFKTIEKIKEVPKAFVPKIIQYLAILGGVFLALIITYIFIQLYVKYVVIKALKK